MGILQDRKFSPYRLISVIGLAAIIVGSAIANDIAYFVFDISSIGLIVGITFFLLLGAFGKDFLKFIPDSFITLIYTPSKPNKKYAQIAKFAGRYVIGAATIATLIRMFYGFANLSAPESLGYNTIATLLPFFYALILSEIFFALIYKSYLDGNENETTPEFPLKKVTLSIIIVALVCMNFAVHLYTNNVI